MVPAIHGLVNSALRIRAPQTTKRRHVHHIRILWMNHDSSDVPRGLQPHFFPGLAAIDRFVRSVAPGGALPVVWLAGTDPNHGRVRGGDGDVADGRDTLLIKYWFPSRAVVRCLPYAARSCAHIHDVGIALHHCEIINAPAHRRGAKFAEFQVFEFIGGIRLVAGSGLRANSPSAQRRRANQSYPQGFPRMLHFNPPCAKPSMMLRLRRTTHQVFWKGKPNPWKVRRAAPPLRSMLRPILI